MRSLFLCIAIVLSCAACSLFDSILGTTDQVATARVGVDQLVAAGVVFGDRAAQFEIDVRAAAAMNDPADAVQGLLEMKELVVAVLAALGVEFEPAVGSDERDG